MSKSSGDLVFEVIQEQNGDYVAECLNDDIVTQADSWEELRENVKDELLAFK